MRIREGGKDLSIDVVYKSLSDGLLRYITELIQSKLEAQDIFSHCFYKLLIEPRVFSSYEHVRRWLYVIARNMAIDFLRKKNKLKLFSDDMYYLSYDCEIQKSKENAYAMLLKSTFESLNDLPRQRQAVFKLYFLHGKSTAQIAELLNLNNQTVLNHKNKAIENLRKLLLLKEETADLMEEALPL